MSRSITRAAPAPPAPPRRTPPARSRPGRARNAGGFSSLSISAAALAKPAFRGAERRPCAVPATPRPRRQATRERRGQLGLGAAMAPPAVGAQRNDIACCRHVPGAYRGSMPAPSPVPHRDCPLCPAGWRRGAPPLPHPSIPDSGGTPPVPALGDPDPWLVIIGLRPRQKRRQPHRPRLHRRCPRATCLLATLAKFRTGRSARAAGRADPHTPSNALPPDNKPVPAEIPACRDFLTAEIAALPSARIFVALGGDRAPVGGRDFGRAAAQGPLRPSRRASPARWADADR